MAEPIDDLARLIAKDGIRDLALRYAVAVDGKDLDALTDLFAPDVDNGRFGTGPDGVRRFFDQSLRRFHCSMHFVGNHLIDVEDPDHATGIVYCQAFHHVLDPEHWFDEWFAYWDTYERIDGAWRFRRRRVRSWYREGSNHPELGDTRIEAAATTSGPRRGSRMPEAFPTFEPFWARPPLATPGD